MTRTLNIIIVDDEKFCRLGVSSCLKNTEINVLGQAESGSELLSILKTKTPDIVLLDLEMPVLNGSRTLNILRRDFPGIRTIILSRYHDEELIKDMFNRGALAFVSKHSEVDVLLSAIRRVAAYGIYLDNVPCLLKSPAIKDGHYYKLILTPRELTVLHHIYESESYKQIGNILCISGKTVENHAKSIYEKLHVKSRSEFCILITKLGLNYIGGK